MGAILPIRRSRPAATVTRPSTWRLLWSPRAWRQWIRWKTETLTVAHAEFVYDAVAPHVPRGARVLDVGAYDAQVTARVADRLGCDVLAVDVVDAGDRRARGVPFRRYDGATLPVDDGDHDVVMLLFMLHHAKDDLAVLREARRAVADGGRVLVGEDMVEGLGQRAITVGFHLWLLTFTFMGWKGTFRRIAAWRARFAEAGLDVEDVVELGPHLGKRLWPRNVLFVLRPR